MRQLASLCLASFLLGCTSFTSKPEIVEINSVDDQALAQVLQTPNSFYLNAKEAGSAWGKATYFFSTYTSTLPVSHSMSEQSSNHLVGVTPSKRFEYSVTQTPRGNAFHYSVTCKALKKEVSGDLAHAELNGKNLARFLREGYLEVSLLVD
jgi:hypothetical protein